MRTARRPALRAPPTATVATGIPAGIWTIDSSESRPSRCANGRGAPVAGRGGAGGGPAGRAPPPPPPTNDPLRPRAGRRPAVTHHVVRHPVRRDDVGLVVDAELFERRRRRLHHRP